MHTTAPARGRKHCPGCNFYIGVRSKQCECGHVFESAPAPVIEKITIPIPREPRQVGPVAMKGGSMRIVLTPAGECPVKLQGTSKEQVVKWADDLQEIAGKRQDYLHSDALKYYARQFFDVTSPEYRDIVEILEGFQDGAN